MKIGIISIIIVSTALISTLYLKNNRIKTTSERTTFVIGTVGDYAPWVSINKDGEYEGFDIDVAKSLAEQMGKQLEIKDLGSMTSLFVALDQGSIDAIIWGLSITQERLEKVAMVHYQGGAVTAYSLLFWKTIPEYITSLDDMTGMIVCVEPASAQEAVLRDFPNVNIKQTERVDDALLNIQYGKADAALVEPAIANKFKRTYPEILVIDVPLSPLNQVYGVGIAIKKNNTSLVTVVNQAITTLKQKGILAYYEKKWDIL